MVEVERLRGGRNSIKRELLASVNNMYTSCIDYTYHKIDQKTYKIFLPFNFLFPMKNTTQKSDPEKLKWWKWKD